MSRGSRSRTLLILLGTLLAAGPARAEDKPGAPAAETKAAGQWKDPPAKAATPTTNAAVSPVPTPAKMDEPGIAARFQARAPRRSVKVGRASIRRVASRARPVRQERVEVVRKTERPSRRIVARGSAPPRETRAGAARSLRPVYGFIPPEAPADAYYERRRFGTVGNRSGDLGLPAEGGPAYRTVGLREGGRLVIRWRGPGIPVTGPGPISPFDAFGAD